jgi:hypothetical protein
MTVGWASRMPSYSREEHISWKDPSNGKKVIMVMKEADTTSKAIRL